MATLSVKINDFDQQCSPVSLRLAQKEYFINLFVYKTYICDKLQPYIAFSLTEWLENFIVDSFSKKSILQKHIKDVMMLKNMSSSVQIICNVVCNATRTPWPVRAPGLRWLPLFAIQKINVNERNKTKLLHNKNKDFFIVFSVLFNYQYSE